MALFVDRRIEAAGPNWHDLVEQLGEEFLRAQIADRRRQKAEEESHEAVLLRSAFSAIERYGVIVAQKLNANDIVGRVYSTSTTSPEALGDKRQAFEQTLRERLARLSPNGEFSEAVEVNALIARRLGIFDADDRAQPC